MINIVVPMAGRGSRFKNAGYKVPKPLIDIYGHSMIEYVIRNITPKCDYRFIFICQREHITDYNLDKKIISLVDGSIIIPINYVTEGAACTVLLAEKYINNQDQLMIANSDQYIDTDINDYIKAINQFDGLIMTMPSDHPKWSYIKYDDNGFVTMVREKEVISNDATVGIYNFKYGSDFVKYAHSMIDNNKRVNNEFYVAPVYNEMINDGRKIVYYNVGDKMYGLGVPDDLEYFMSTPISKKVFS